VIFGLSSFSFYWVGLVSSFATSKQILDDYFDTAVHPRDTPEDTNNPLINDR